jgi:hypothetical protein
MSGRATNASLLTLRPKEQIWKESTAELIDFEEAHVKSGALGRRAKRSLDMRFLEVE